MENVSLGKNANADLFRLYEQYATSGKGKTTNAGKVEKVNLWETKNSGTVQIEGCLTVPELGDGMNIQPIDMEELEKASSDLQKMTVNTSNPLRNNVQAAGYGTGSEVMLSMTKIMTLLLDTFKELKQAYAEKRKSAMLGEYAQTMAEADMTRKGGRVALIIGLSFAGAQATMAGFSGFKSITAAKGQLGMMKTPEMANAAQNVKMIGNAQTADTATAQMQKMQDSLGITQEQAGKINSDFFAEANQKVEAFNQVDGNNAQEMNQARLEARNAFDNGMEKYDQAIMDKEAQVEQLEIEVKNNPQPNQEHPEGMMQEIDELGPLGVNEEEGGGQANPQPAEPNKAQQLETAKQELADLKAQRQYAKAVQLEGKAKVSTQEQLKGDLVEAQEEHMAQSKNISNSLEYKEYDLTLKRMEFLQSLNPILGSLSQSIAGNEQSKYQSAGIKHQAEGKKLGSMQEELSEGVRNLQDGINAVSQLAQAILSMDRDTNAQIIRG